MFKRRTVKLIVFTLVICGLAGAATNNALKYYERKALVQELKESETAFLNQLEGLNAAQLTFKTPGNGNNIQDIISNCLAHEKNTWLRIDSLFKEGYNPIINKETVSEILLNKKTFFKIMDRAKPDPNFKKALQDLHNLSIIRNNRIQYVRITTQNLHGKLIKCDDELLSAYECMRNLAADMNIAADEIASIKTQPLFKNLPAK